MENVNFMKLSDCFGDNPKIIPVATVSSTKAVALTNQRKEASTTDDSNDESSTLDSTSPKKRRKETPKKRRRSKSSASEMIDFLKEFREEKKKEDQERVILIERMHADKMTASKFILYDYGYCDTEVNTQVSRDSDSDFRFY